MGPRLQDLLAHHHPGVAAGVPDLLVIRSHLAIKSYDLVVALTDGGPGTRPAAGDLHVHDDVHPQRDGLGAASATVMLMTVAAIIVPYLYSELRQAKRAVMAEPAAAVAPASTASRSGR